MRARERPIIFSAAMVRALCQGGKTQTRRALVAQDAQAAELAARRYGHAGDRLWVKEAWRVHRRFDALPPSALPEDVVVDYLADTRLQPDAGRTRVSLHLPRRLSRLLLDVRQVRVERLQEISEADARAEGLPQDLLEAAGGHPIAAYRLLWERINGTGSWARDPWLAVIEFHVRDAPRLA